MSKPCAVMRSWVCIACLLLLCGPISAQEVTVVIHSEPQGAAILDFSGRIGTTGEEFPITLKNYPEGYAQLTLSKEGYEAEPITVRVSDLQTDRRYPSSGAVRLHLSNPAGPILGKLGLAAGLLSLFLTPLLLKRRRQQQQMSMVEELAAESGYHDSKILLNLSGYRPVAFLGRGAMSTVYRAVREDDPEGEPVAAKIIHRDLCLKPEFVARYRREVNVYRGLSHPNIVALLDWGAYDDLLYIVLEYVEGETLRGRLTGPLPVPSVLELLEPIFEALQYAHAQGVFHRDLKPENVMVDKGGRVKVMDFGLAKVVNAEKLTQTGTTLGTPAYMPPEQIKAVDVGPPADQYALGAMAFEMLTGRLPFPADDPYQMLFAHLSDPVPELRSLRPELPEALEAVITKMLAKEPDERFASLEEAWRELRDSAKA